MRACIAIILALSGASFAQKRDAEFAKLANRFCDDCYFKYDPVSGTAAGFHQYDPMLATMSRAEIDAQIASLKKFAGEVEAFGAQGLSAGAASGRGLVVGQIRGSLLTLGEIRPWGENPDNYLSGVSNAIFLIMSRSFAPASVRLKSAIAREKQIPRVFQSARENLKNPPKVYTEVALEQLPGIVSFFHDDVPAAFKDVKDGPLLEEFKLVNQVAMDALDKYKTWLKDDLLPRSNGDFRIGAENYRKKLLYDEMVEIPLDRLLELGPQNMRHHPSAATLLQSFKDVLSGLRRFIEQHKIVTIPSEVPPIVEETPPFMRALTTASMDTPGPYEKVAKEAFFNVTLPDKSWDKKQTEEYLEGFSKGTIISTATHEAFPGHYVQFLWVQRAPSKVRKLLGCSSNAEGWAHYSEQMMLDEGYGAGDLKLRLGQLQDALLRNARFIAGIQMHLGKMTVEEATEFFVKEGYQVRPVAEKEAKRGTSDPTYLVYTLGKLETQLGR